MIYALYIVVIVVLVTLDQLSKYFIVNNFAESSKVVIIDNFFNITYVKNYGAGFSIFQNMTTFLNIVSIIAIIIFSIWLIKAKKHETLNIITYLLFIGGSIGNFLDRFRYSYVVDFLDFYIFGYDYPVFNLADCFIVIGLFLLIISYILEIKREKNKIGS